MNNSRTEARELFFALANNRGKNREIVFDNLLNIK